MLLTAFLIDKYNTKLPRSPPSPDELIGFYNAEKSPIEKFTVEKVYLRTDPSFTSGLIYLTDGRFLESAGLYGQSKVQYLQVEK